MDSCGVALWFFMGFVRVVDSEQGGGGDCALKPLLVDLVNSVTLRFGCSKGGSGSAISVFVCELGVVCI